MQESQKAEELERRIRSEAKKRKLRKIRKLVLKTGSGYGETREDLEYLIGNKFQLKNYEIIDGEVVMVCSRCRKIPDDETHALGCPSCGSIKFDIYNDSGVEILGLE